jgi:hypothetical protein
MWNVALPLLLIVLLSWASVKPERDEVSTTDRLSITFTMFLTAVAFKFGGYMPYALQICCPQQLLTTTLAFLFVQFSPINCQRYVGVFVTKQFMFAEKQS